MRRLDQCHGFPPLRHRLFILAQPRMWQVWVLVAGLQLALLGGCLIARRACACREVGPTASAASVAAQLGRECATDPELPPKEE